MVQRIVAESCAGAVIDVQDFFLAQIEGEETRGRMETNLVNFARLLNYFRIPIIATLERPVRGKGPLPRALEAQLADAKLFEKDFFDLTKEDNIRDHLARLNKKQVIVAGCETDVCVLQSCLGLIDLGFEVFVVEDLIFSSARDVTAALARMHSAGAVFLTYKTLYFELTESVEGAQHKGRLSATVGPLPDDLPDTAE